MANSDKNIVITPNRGSTSDPKIEFTDGNNSTLQLVVEDTDSGPQLSFKTAGSFGSNIFAISNFSDGTVFNLSGSDDVPLFSVEDNREVRLVPNGGYVGIETSGPETALDMSGSTSSLTLPNGTISNRPDSENNGQMRYNTETGSIEARVGDTWVDVVTDYQMYASVSFG